MEQTIIDYLDKFEENMSQQLANNLLESDDMNEVWQKVAPHYVADAVKEIAKYPTVALGWAMYLGMGIANLWDKDWEKYGAIENIYEYIRDKRGFDYMDEVVREDIMGLKGEQFSEMEKKVQSCAQQAESMIRHEHIEPQSPMAFHVYARSIRVLYKIGVSNELQRLGYKRQRIN